MKKILLLILALLLVSGGLVAQHITPADYWGSLTDGEKLAFINGAYTALSRAKAVHIEEVKKMYGRDPYYREPYFIERFYEVIDEHISEGVGYNIDIIVQAVDALYANYDNVEIPVIEAIRIVSTAQDGDKKTADVLLLKAQRTYQPEK